MMMILGISWAMTREARCHDPKSARLVVVELMFSAALKVKGAKLTLANRPCNLGMSPVGMQNEEQILPTCSAIIHAS